MFKYNPSSLTSKVAITFAGVLFMLSTAGVIAAPECYGNWRITGTDYNGNPVDVTRIGFVDNQGCGIHWEGHSVLYCYVTRGLDGRRARWYNFTPTYNLCPDLVQVYNSDPHPDEFFRVTIRPY